MIATSFTKQGLIYNVNFTWGNCNGTMQISGVTLLNHVLDRAKDVWVDFNDAENYLLTNELETIQDFINKNTK